MKATLQAVVLSLAAAVVLLNAAIVAARIVLTRREKRRDRFRPRAETLLAEYLAGAPASSLGAVDRERPVLLEVALEAIADLRGVERARLVDLLERLGFVDDAIRELTARRRVTRRRAAETLAAIGSPAATGALTAALRDPDVLVRVTCAWTLAETGGESAVPAITATVIRDAALAPGAAAAAVLALGTRHPSALAPLLTRDVGARVRMTAIAVVSELRLPQHLPSLRACLADCDAAGGDADEVAATAARGLGLIGDAEAAEALMGVASDGGRAPAVRVAAAQALGSIGDPRAVPVLEAQLDARDWRVRAAATRALGELGEPGITALRRAARSDRAEVRALAEAALQR